VKSQPLETIASGYGLVEGPTVDDQDNLFFIDSLGSAVYKRSPDGEMETLADNRPGAGGLCLHTDGGFVASGANVVHVKNGEERVLLEVEGARINDFGTDSSGRIYAGAVRWDAWAGQSPTPGELWRVNHDGPPEELYGDVILANGLGFSPDGSRLYHCDFSAGTVILHDVDEDGSISNWRVFAKIDRGMPDGMAIDEEGAVWVALFNGGAVARFHSDGSLDDYLEVPAQMVTNLCFGGEDRRDVYVVTADNTEDPSRNGSIFKTRVEVPGHPVTAASV
jgi:sugar lactone lactonase YvrE